jgi:hypothetical protein
MTTIRSVNLKPATCPFCKEGDARRVRLIEGTPSEFGWGGNRTVFRVECATCCAHGPMKNTGVAAVEAWNDPIPASVEAAPKATPAGRSASLTPEGRWAGHLHPDALDAMDWLQLHQAAAGAGSGSVIAWPRLRDALRKLIGLPAVSPFPAGMSVPPPTTGGSPS